MNDVPGLTLTYFKARSNLVPNAFKLEKSLGCLNLGHLTKMATMPIYDKTKYV